MTTNASEAGASAVEKGASAEKLDDMNKEETLSEVGEEELYGT